MTTIADVHRELYRLAADLQDGADASYADQVREFADSLVPSAAEEVGGTYSSTPVAPNTSLGESDVRRGQELRTEASGYNETVVPVETGDATQAEDKSISRIGDAGNTSAER